MRASSRPLRVEYGLHCTLDVPFQKDDYCMHLGHAPTVMGIRLWATVNMVRTVPRDIRSGVFIRLLRDQIERHP